jgi:hypothetical protein
VSDLSGARPAALSPEVRAAIRALEVDRATADAVRRLRASAIPSVVLKGPSHARWLYDDPDDRPYDDCDLLVPERSAREAESALAEIGFVRRGFESVVEDRPRYGYPLFRADDIAVDLHVTFVGVGAPPARLWDVLAARTTPMTVAGVDVAVLEPTARTLVLALHAAKDGGKRRGRGAKAIRDLELAIERVPSDVWRGAAALAADLDAVGAFAAGIRRVAAGERLAADLELSDRLRPDVALRLEQPPPLAVGVDWLLHGDDDGRGPRGVVGRARVALRKVLPPPSHVRAWSPLARRGRLGLVLAYVGRPFWVAWRAIPAMLAVRRARRLAARDGGRS